MRLLLHWPALAAAVQADAKQDHLDSMSLHLSSFHIYYHRTYLQAHHITPPHYMFIHSHCMMKTITTAAAATSSSPIPISNKLPNMHHHQIIIRSSNKPMHRILQFPAIRYGIDLFPPLSYHITITTIRTAETSSHLSRYISNHNKKHNKRCIDLSLSLQNHAHAHSSFPLLRS
jgi:hypothetical protein